LATPAGVRDLTDYLAARYGFTEAEAALLRRSELSLIDRLEGPPSPWYSPAFDDGPGTTARGRGVYSRRLKLPAAVPEDGDE
jgi:hypothetical protein